MFSTEKRSGNCQEMYIPVQTLYGIGYALIIHYSSNNIEFETVYGAGVGLELTTGNGRMLAGSRGLAHVVPGPV